MPRIHGVHTRRLAVDEWPLANVIDAAIDEQRRRWGRPRLPDRNDHECYQPVPQPGPDRWPGVNTNSPLTYRGSTAGAALCAALEIYDDDLWRTVINVHLATFG